MIKIAVIGGTGLLGSNLVGLYDCYDVKAFSRSHSSNLSEETNYIIDFNNIFHELDLIFQNWTPDIIINTVALVNLEKCENEFDVAYNVNCMFAGEIARVTKKISAYYIHISTDHFFNDYEEKHKETDKVTLLNNYAKTKISAEELIIKEYANTLIVRTNIIGFRKNNINSFFEWILESLQKSNEIYLYTNFFTSPISVKELGNILLKCYNENLVGVYNIGSSEVISKYDFGIKVADVFNLSIDNINKSELNNNFSPLKRALTLGLDVSKIEKALSFSMPTIDQTLISLNNEYRSNNE